MQTQWEFRHAETGSRCRANFDGSMLEVEVFDPKKYVTTGNILAGNGTLRTFCASKEVAYRELRLHCGEADLREIAA